MKTRRTRAETYGPRQIELVLGVLLRHSYLGTWEDANPGLILGSLIRRTFGNPRQSQNLLPQWVRLWAIVVFQGQQRLRQEEQEEHQEHQEDLRVRLVKKAVVKNKKKNNK